MSAAPLLAPPLTREAALDPTHDLVRRGLIRTALADLTAYDDGSVVTTALLVECHLAQGDLGTARALGERLAAAGDHAWAHYARAELASASGEPDLAVEHYRAVAVAVAGAPGSDDVRLPWRAGAALALLRLGHRAEALDLARHQHELALAHGTSYDVALALRVLATTEPSIDAATQRVARLRTALRMLAPEEAQRLRAQIETDLAGLLLLEGRRDEALDLLRSAEAYAGREDLWPLQSRVRRLLERMGETPRRAESEALAVLTAAERRVALLALEGLTNRQIAEHLVVSIKAIEGHLSKVYRKLGLASRAALVASFGLR